MSQRMISTTVYLRPDQIKDLKRLSDKTGIPQAVMIRRGVDFAITETKSDRALGKRGGK